MATTTFDEPHVQQESTLHIFKNTSRLQCVIPTSPSSSINMDIRSSTPQPSRLVAPPPSPTDPNIDHITSLERSLCSDFLCCGAHLPDLHALLEHFEEDHIMVLAPNGKRVYPPEGLRAVPLHPLPTSLHTTPSSSRSSSVLSSPNSASCPLSPSSPSPSSPSDLPSFLQGTFERRKSNIVVAPVYTPFTPSLPLDPAYPYPDSTEIDMPLYDFSQDFYPHYSVQLPTSHFDDDDDDDEDMSDTSVTAHPTSPIPTYVYGPDKTHPIAQIPKTARSVTLDNALKMSISKTSKAKSRQINPSSSSSISKKREKAYRCPTPRCTKSYLNPNGLKYHLEKGTCKIETECESEAGEDYNLLPATPITTPPTPSSSTRISVPEHLEMQQQQQQPSPLTEVGGSNIHRQQNDTTYYYDRPEPEEHRVSLLAQSEPKPSFPSRQSRQQQQQQFQYQYQYQRPSSARPVYPGQMSTPITGQ